MRWYRCLLKFLALSVQIIREGPFFQNLLWGCTPLAGIPWRPCACGIPIFTVAFHRGLRISWCCRLWTIPSRVRCRGAAKNSWVCCRCRPPCSYLCREDWGLWRTRLYRFIPPRFCRSVTVWGCAWFFGRGRSGPSLAGRSCWLLPKRWQVRIPRLDRRGSYRGFFFCRCWVGIHIPKTTNENAPSCAAT